jgi:hypothetical protein
LDRVLAGHGKLEQWQIRGGTAATCHRTFTENAALWKNGARGGSIPLAKTEIQYIGIPS